jgi:hypothetical protein
MVAKIRQNRHAFIFNDLYSKNVVQAAFVIRLGAGTEAGQRRLAGWIEEVDTARAIRFQSTAELIEFLVKCFEESARSEEGGKPEPSESRGTHRI